jgi:hypothetical protein
MRIRFAAGLLLAAALAGCGGLNFHLGGSNSAQPLATVDANLYPANYRMQIARLLATLLKDRADFSGALISPPALKPVADSPNLHYVVCVQLDGHNVERNKVVIYLAGEPTQFIDATPQQCGDAAYQPFPELQTVKPEK